VLVQSPAVAFFVACARVVRPDFTLGTANALIVAQICAHLDGLPLAIELAVPRLTLLPPRALLQRLSRRLEVLTGGARDLPARQQTLQATIAWSYDLLSREEQTLFTRLSIFAGGWTLEAAEQACHTVQGDAIPVLEGLASLIEKNLVYDAHVADPEAERRFGMLETLREFAQAQLAGRGEEEQLLRQHAGYYLAEARQAVLGEREWGRLDVEQANLRMAVQWAEDHHELVPGIAGAMVAGELPGQCANLGEWRQRLERLCTAAARAVPATDKRAGRAAASREITRWRAKGLCAASSWAFSQGDAERSDSLQEESLALFREIGDTCGVASALAYLGLLARDHWGDYDRATALLTESQALYRTMPTPPPGMSWAVTMLGLAIAEQGNLERAAALLDESLAIAQEAGDTDSLPHVLDHLGQVLHARGEDRRAEAYLVESLAHFRRLSGKWLWLVAYTTLNLSAVVRGLGDYTRAAELLQESHAIFQDLGDKRGCAHALAGLADVARLEGDYHRAAQLYRASLALYYTPGTKHNAAVVLEGWAETMGMLGHPRRAARLFGAAAALRAAVGMPLPPNVRAGHESALTRVREALGEGEFTAAWAEGYHPEKTPRMHHLIDAALDERDP
jgi:tetratricopeptide (TPR) repeat protein